jgi:transcriptional regulator with XRE-family HTH domain
MNSREMLLKEKYGKVRGGQAKLARDLKVKQGVITKWFTGERSVGIDYIASLSKIFKKSEAEIKKIFSILPGQEAQAIKTSNFNSGENNGNIGNIMTGTAGIQLSDIEKVRQDILKEIEILKLQIELLRKELLFERKK